MNILSNKYTTLFLRLTLAFSFQLYIGNGNAQKVEVRQLKIGKSSESVFASDYFNNHIYFCSDKKIKSKKESINEFNLNFLDIYSIAYDHKKNILGEYVRLNENINSPLNEGPIDFNDDTNFGYFSSNIKDSSTSELFLGLFQTQKKGELYGKKEPIYKETFAYNIAHPTINEAGTVLVFSSDKPDSKGQTDLYFSSFEMGEWSAPKVISGVNTEAIETFPHFYKNTLYFASDRLEGKGGLDIYYCDVDQDKFSDVKHLDGAINSEFDDFLFIPINETAGIFSSNRNQFDRIFSYHINLPQPVELFEINDNFCYELSDDGNIDTSRYQHEWELGDGTKKFGHRINHCYTDTGNYEVTCNLIDSKSKTTEKAFISTEINLNIDKPTIVYAIEGDVLNLSLDQKYSKIKYSKQYWIINNKIFNTSKPSITLNNKKNFDIQVVIWEENKESNAFGIVKKLTLN